MAKKLNIEAPLSGGERGEIATMSTIDNGKRPKAQPKKQVGVRFPEPMFEDMDALRMIMKLRGENWSLKETIVQLMEEYLEKYREDSDDFRERTRGA